MGGALPSRPLDPALASASSEGANPGEAPLELQLLGFPARRRAAVAQVTRGRALPGEWPREVVALFQDFFDDLLVSLDPESPAPLSKRALIQARVVPEAELEMTVTKLGPPPPELQRTLSRVHLAVAWHMRLLALRARGVDSKDPLRGVTMVWPVQNVLITSTYGHRRDPILGELRFHAGVDLGGQRGELVFAAAEGVVREAEWVGGYGRRVLVEHGEGLVTLYAHLDALLVVPGSRVELGSPIGFIGASGRATGPHLHFEVRQYGEALDPFDVVGRSMTRPGLAAASHSR